MTRSLSLSPNTEAILQKAAATRHMALADYLSELVEREAARLASINSKDADSPSRTEHRRRVKELRGSRANIPGTVDDFLRERRAENS